MYVYIYTCTYMYVCMYVSMNLYSYGKLLACNNLVYYKVATSLKTPWICSVFHLVTRL